MNLQRLRQPDIWIVCAAAALPFFIVVGSYAQAGRFAITTVRDDRRLERKVDDLEKAHTEIQRDIEKRLAALELDVKTRLTTLETYAKGCLWLLALIAGPNAASGAFKLFDRYKQHHSSKAESEKQA